MHILKPQGRGKKHDIRFRNHDGRTVRIPGEPDHADAVRKGVRVEMLVRAKQNGDAPPGELASWIEHMPKSMSDRLVSLGLLDGRRFQRAKPLEEHFVEYGRIVATRKSNHPRHVAQCEAKARRVCKALKIENLKDFNATRFGEYLKGQSIATSTRRAYIIVMKDFMNEMKRLGAINENALEHVVAPGADENPEYERQPLTVAQFQDLMKLLDTFERYKHQNARWTARDRKMIYWTAVKTGYRQSEMKALVKANFDLDSMPPVVTLKARHTKNKTLGQVPIPNDLAEALRTYIADLEPTDKVFVFPMSSGSIVDMLRRDLKGAGINWKLPTGEIIDFHTLRSTAITWWLTVDGLPPKVVQVLARLKTLALVQNYSRNFRITDWSWLNTSPRLAASTDVSRPNELKENK